MVADPIGSLENKRMEGMIQLKIRIREEKKSHSETESPHALDVRTLNDGIYSGCPVADFIIGEVITKIMRHGCGPMIMDDFRWKQTMCQPHK